MKPDCFSQTYVPPHAIQCWCDDTAVYTAVPVKNGPPLIQKHPLTEGGLSKALNFLRVRHRTVHGGRYDAPVQSYRPAANLPKTTISQRTAIRDMLRRRGII